MLRTLFVLTISLMTFVSSTEGNGQGRNNNVNKSTRNKRFHNHYQDGWDWSSAGGYRHGYPENFHHNHNNHFNHGQSHYNDRQNFYHNTPSTQVHSNYDLNADPYSISQNVPIPSKFYFNQQRTKPVFQPQTPNMHKQNPYINIEPSYSQINTNLQHENTKAIQNQRPIQIYINLHIYNNGHPNHTDGMNITQNDPFNRLNDSPNIPINTNRNNSQSEPTKDRTTERSPISDALPLEINASIDPKVFGAGVALDGQVIGPTGSLMVYDNSSVIFAQASEISCETEYKRPKKPNFFVPGRRVSEAQCYEYIFDLKIKDEIVRRNERCNIKDDEFASIRKSDLKNFVVGGREADQEEFSHMVAIGWMGVTEPVIFKCGGSLISPDYVLTAAHCRSSAPDTELADLNPKIARMGGNSLGYRKTGQIFIESRRRRQALDPGQLDRKIIDITTHPQYDPNMKYYDIALMLLDQSVEFNRRVKPACLWIDLETSNRIKRAVATGWGIENPRTGRTSLTLQAGELDILDSNGCNNLLRSKFGKKFSGFADHQLCAGKLSGEIDVCQGDSGGPLQVKVNIPTTRIGNMHAIVGIISAGPDCGKANMPGIYTKVASYINWLEPIVWSANK